MSLPYVTKLAKEKGMSVAQAERKWDKAKDAAKKAGHGEEYRYVTGIFKKMMGESLEEGWRVMTTEDTPEDGTKAKAMGVVGTITDSNPAPSGEYVTVKVKGKEGYYHKSDVMIKEHIELPTFKEYLLSEGVEPFTKDKTYLRKSGERFEKITTDAPQPSPNIATELKAHILNPKNPMDQRVKALAKLKNNPDVTEADVVAFEKAVRKTF